MRIIPRNTKVATEFFTGVSLADIIVGTVGVMLILLVVVSNLPYKVVICCVILALFVLLLARIETESNYMFLLRIVKHFSYHRSYRKLQEDSDEETDEMDEMVETEEDEESEITVISREVKEPKKRFAWKKPSKKKEEGAAQA